MLSRVQFFAIPWNAARQASLPITNSQSLLKLIVLVSNNLILCCSLLLPPSTFPSIKVFSSESVLHIRWPNLGSFSFSISPSKEYSGVISFRTDWFDFPAVQSCVIQGSTVIKLLETSYAKKNNKVSQWVEGFNMKRNKYESNLITHKKKKSGFKMMEHFYE